MAYWCFKAKISEKCRDFGHNFAGFNHLYSFITPKTGQYLKHTMLLMAMVKKFLCNSVYY